MKFIKFFLLDTLVIFIFVKVGIQNHDIAWNPLKIMQIAWPFLLALIIAWFISKASNNPTRLIPTALIIWLTTVFLGLILRVFSGESTAFVFQVVTFVMLGIGFNLWRLIFKIVKNKIK